MLETTNSLTYRKANSLALGAASQAELDDLGRRRGLRSGKGVAEKQEYGTPSDATQATLGRLPHVTWCYAAVWATPTSAAIVI